jgi:hypothetical protein
MAPTPPSADDRFLYAQEHISRVMLSFLEIENPSATWLKHQLRES